MFMSKFSSVPSIMMIEALGIASAHGKQQIADRVAIADRAEWAGADLPPPADKTHRAR
jgi:hypothetical protein